MSRKKVDRKELFKALKKGKIAPLYYLHGPDVFMLETAVDAIVAAALPEGPNDFNFEKFRGGDSSPEAVRNAAETLPFMTKRRVVVVRDVQEFSAPELEDLIEYFEDPAPTTCMVVVATKKLHGGTRAAKALSKSAEEFEFTELKEWEVGDIVKRNARQIGFEIDEGATAYLVEALGTDMAALMGALEKIDLFIGPERRQATVEDVSEIVADTRVKTVFDLTKAVGTRSMGDALKILDRMLIAGEEAIGINAMVARHFRIVGKLHDPDITSLQKNDMARAVGAHPYFLDEYRADARRFSKSEVIEIRRRLMQTDFALKSSRLSDRTIVEGLLVAICSRPESANAS